MHSVYMVFSMPELFDEIQDSEAALNFRWPECNGVSFGLRTSLCFLQLPREIGTVACAIGMGL